jgi:stage V sporulation protein D (sporulation-specific penicillin-binding protein)
MENKKRAQQPRKKRRRRTPPEIRRIRRFQLVAWALIFCVFGLIFRIWHIQEFKGDEYSQWAAIQRANRDRDRVSATFAPARGTFVDRHLQPITGTSQVFTVYMDVEALHNRHVRRSTTGNDIREEVFDAIFQALNVPRWELLEMFRINEATGELLMETGRNHRILRTGVPAEIAIPLTERFAEIHRTEESLRWYPDPFFAPQVIGFTRGDASWGLEFQYRTELAGQAGRNIWAQGETESVPVRDGYTIVTTLDSEIQRLAQHYVDRTFIQHPSNFVGMIVMDPFTGEVLAMTQAPTFSLADPFNPEYFTDPHIAEIWEHLDESSRTNEVMSLWRNYHITRSSEPGSVFKPFVVAAAIEEGIITPHTTFHCEGAREFGEMVVRCHSWPGSCGSLTLRRAIYRSCNLAMADINRWMGRDLFYNYRGYFGFGERTGIDLPGEADVSHPSVMYPYARLHAVEMATSAMGQGFNATTMQLINGYAALINGGNLLRPYLVSQIVDSSNTIIHETMPGQVVRRVISQETSDFIRNEMQFVVSNIPGAGEMTSTAWRSHIPGHSIGGKTGTAQQGIRDERNHNLTYICFLPVENPQFLILMTIDRVEDDSIFAGDTVPPIVREFLLDLIRIRNIQPTDEANAVTHEILGTTMPDYSGQRLSDAVRNIMNSGARGYQVIGGGTVVSHTWPAAGHLMPETARVIFYMNPETRISERMVSVPDVVGLTTERASLLLTDMGLPVIEFIDRRENNNNNDANFNPRTAPAEPIGEGYSPPVPTVHTIYEQFPAAGSEIEQGTQVILRVR